ncbi:MAG: YiiD C-terminal domain-containing protein [Rhizobacter sp.]|nr:YiiD C-terminal domain-containing protein [Bacteriovorax sp.]
MNKEIIQKIIEKEIPIVKSMGVEFSNFSHDSCTIIVPLEPNHNHKGTAFGGSLYSACTSACYGLMFALQREDDLSEFELMIGEGSIRYIKPVEKDFFVEANLLPEDWILLKEKIQKNGFGKISLSAFVYTQERSQHLCEYRATFILKKIQE